MRDDIEFNTAFCKLIEKHPALYDYMRPDYCNRSVQEQIWKKIARELNERVPDCKDRWKNIRARYLKNLKERARGASTDKIIKEYYLAQHLQFVHKFLKRGLKKRKVNNSDEEGVLSPEESGSVSNSPCQPLGFLCSKDRDSQSREAITTTETVIDPDLSFLQSLLPDMRAMTDNQKRKFKIAILNIAGQILEENQQTANVPVNVMAFKIEEPNWANPLICNQQDM